jgi:polysaccharide biosynthesis transport protein
VDAGRTRYGAIEGSVKRLRAANAFIVGAVIDRLGRAGHGYGYNYDYHYTYSYSYGSQDEGRALAERV